MPTLPGTRLALRSTRRVAPTRRAHPAQPGRCRARTLRDVPACRRAPVPTSSLDDPKRRVAKSPRTSSNPDKNRPLIEDIRFLGRILGEVIREQEGKDAFELIERVRKLSVGYRLKRDASAGKALDRLLKNLSAEQTVSVIRAFSYFSHLANIAEDRHHVRRRLHHEREGHQQEGSLELSFEESGLRNF